MYSKKSMRYILLECKKAGFELTFEVEAGHISFYCKHPVYKKYTFKYGCSLSDVNQHNKIVVARITTECGKIFALLVRINTESEYAVEQILNNPDVIKWINEPTAEQQRLHRLKWEL